MSREYKCPGSRCPTFTDCKTDPLLTPSSCDGIVAVAITSCFMILETTNVYSDPIPVQQSSVIFKSTPGWDIINFSKL